MAEDERDVLVRINPVRDRDERLLHLQDELERPACVASCPTGAMAKDTDTGIVSNDPDVCIGCGACAKACPYGAPAVVETLGIAKKCDM